MNKQNWIGYYCRLARLLNPPRRRRQVVIMANAAVGTHQGTITLSSAAAMASRYRLLAVGENPGEVQLAGVSDAPLGVGLDDAGAAGEKLAVAVLGSGGDTHIGQAGGVVAFGDYLVPAADGKVRALPGTAGSYYIIGRALGDAQSDQRVEFAGCMATLRVIA